MKQKRPWIFVHSPFKYTTMNGVKPSMVLAYGFTPISSFAAAKAILNTASRFS
jgi:hypothetical protein